jgi:hypothetical protein
MKIGPPEIWSFGVVIFTILFMLVYFGAAAK